jgi:hypothetical protein
MISQIKIHHQNKKTKPNMNQSEFKNSLFEMAMATNDLYKAKETLAMIHSALIKNLIEERTGYFLAQTVFASCDKYGVDWSTL